MRLDSATGTVRTRGNASLPCEPAKAGGSRSCATETVRTRGSASLPFYEHRLMKVVEKREARRMIGKSINTASARMQGKAIGA